MISERQANSKPFSSHNSVTGDNLVSKTGNQKAFDEGWSLIWGDKECTNMIEEEKQKFKQQEVENSFKCNIVEQHFLQEQLPSNVIGDEL